MASQHIEVQSTASRLSADVRRFVDNLRDVQEMGVKIKSIADQVAVGGDYAALGTKLGTIEAEAQAVYNLLGSVNGELAGVSINQMLARVG